MAVLINYISFGVKIFTVAQEATGNLWASIAEQMDAWLQDNTNILIRDVHVDRPHSIRNGLESTTVTLLYEYGTRNDGLSTPRGFGHPYRVLFIDTLIGTPYETFNEWYADQDIANGLDDESRIEWIVSMPALRRGDIAKGTQFFGIYAQNDIVTTGFRTDSRQLGAGRGDYLYPMIVEAQGAINNSQFGDFSVKAPNGGDIDTTARGKNIFRAAGNFQAGYYGYAVNDQFRGSPLTISLQFNSSGIP